MSRPRGWWAVSLLAVGLGCSIAPKNFDGLSNPAPLVRARAAAKGKRLPNAVTVPALIDRLGDNDPVVRLSAHEELKKRTGQDFGFVPWADAPERTRAVERWKSWYAGQRRAWLPTIGRPGLARRGRLP